MRVVLLSLLFFSLALTAHNSVAQVRGGKVSAPKLVSKDVESFSKALSAAGLVAKVEGLKALSEVRPEINKILEKVSEELAKAKAQKNIKANQQQFDQLTENINAAAAQAAEARSSKTQYTGSAEKLLQGIEALPGILLEVALAGPKADLQKAVDVSGMMAKVSLRDLSNEGDASVKVREIEERLGTDKDGKVITLDDLIKRCLGGR
jgi:uncharacterized phage infection (PIP) family protein YhgE